MPVIAIPLPCSCFLSETIPKIKPTIEAGNEISQMQAPVNEIRQKRIDISPRTKDAIAKPFLLLFISPLYSGYCAL